MAQYRGFFFIIDLDNGYYLVRFRSENAIEFVRTQGPWVTLGTLFDYSTVDSTF